MSDNKLSFIARNDAEWPVMWDELAKRVDRERVNDGEGWQYMGTVTGQATYPVPAGDGGFVPQTWIGTWHEFRHRAYVRAVDGTHVRRYERVYASWDH